MSLVATPESVTNVAFVAGLVTSVVATLAVATDAARSEVPGGRSLALLFGGAGLWSLATLVSLQPVSPRVRVFLNQVEITGVLGIILGFGLFTYYYSAVEERVSRRLKVVLVAVPLVSLALLWTNPVHGLMWDGFTVVATSPYTIVSWAFDDWFYVHLAYSAGLLLGSVAVLSRFLFATDIYTDQLAAVAVAIVVPLGLYLGHYSGLVGSAYPLTQATFWFSAGLVGYAIHRKALFENLPAAHVLGQTRILQQMPDGAAVVAGDGTVVSVNHTFVGLVGRRADAVLREPVSSVLPAVDLTVPSQETRVSVTTDGTTRLLDLSVTPMERGDALVGHLVLVRDVTDETLRTQQLEVTNRVLRHNLRNKLNLAMGYTEMLVADPDREPSEVRRTARIVYDACENLHGLGEKAQTINGLFERTELTELDVGSVVTRALSRVRAKHPDADVSVEFGHEGRAVGVPTVELAVEELVENAIQHGDGTERGVRVRSSESGERIQIHVRDFGPGIPPMDAAVIEDEVVEEQLFHADGVGLWLAKWTATLSNGSVSFAVTPEGTTATLTLHRTD
jgi:signal transduction histidine kinase